MNKERTDIQKPEQVSMEILEKSGHEMKTTEMPSVESALELVLKTDDNKSIDTTTSKCDDLNETEKSNEKFDEAKSKEGVHNVGN